MKKAWLICDQGWGDPIRDSMDNDEIEAWDEYDYLKRIIQLHESVGE